MSGWYTDIQWTSDRGYKSGSGISFIFLLREDMNLIKLRCTNKEYEVFHCKNYLYCFGGSDLNIKNDCNINYDSNSKLGDDYE